MSQYLPTGKFQWDNPEEWNTDKILAVDDTDSKGYFFEVDLEYPKHLHDLHDQYPFGPEKMEVKEDMLSYHQQGLAKTLNQKVGGEKLLLTLNDKFNYVCHYR